MKKLLLSGIAALFLATGTAHTGDDLQKFPRVRILYLIEKDRHPEVMSSGLKNKIRLTETDVFANPVE